MINPNNLSRTNTETIDLHEIELRNDTTSLNELMPVSSDQINESRIEINEDESSFDANTNENNNNNDNNSDNSNNNIVYFKLDNEENRIAESKT